MDRYDSYKDSGVEWIDKIPSEWEISRLRFTGDLYGGLSGKSGDDFKQDNNPNNKPYIPYTNIFNNTYISKEHFDYVVIDEGENQNLVRKFDLFFLMSSETHEDLGKPCILIEDVDELYLNSFCKGLRVTDSSINPVFLNYQLLGQVHKELISVEGRGFTRINLRQDRLKDTPIFIPPLHQQNQIVSFLDTKTSLIDSLIEKTQRKIELIKEQRTSLINEVVTKGLNPNVEMKDSGVEWIGEIPSHWVTTKLGLYTTKVGSGSTPRGGSEIYVETGIPFIRSQNVHFDGLKLDNVSFIENDVHDSMKGSVVVKNDVLLNITGGSIGRCCVVNIDGEMNVNQHVSIIRTKEKLLNYFLNYIISCDVGQSQVKYNLTGGNREGLTIEGIKDFQISLPPLSEQKEIVEYLDNEIQLIDTTVSNEEKRIELLKEYRQSLISEVVTGKIKVS
ncbi:restriction endonuclease subunit S [Muricauda oceani]|uniref:Restriction endonuclease subunit S n=1 Tax=Flagellimonas oceani TaxID=2698672 RepID=A0A6G7IZP8_9FLAO|nr:restriction endonuclease subunit S [Allomuricauda oceani]MBW8245173.1 restriction endonuclease subunit S [Allomuricauda oceani]QII43818.1 restriction endonuclease subunit S [Allomuricauda oceani]